MLTDGEYQQKLITDIVVCCHIQNHAESTPVTSCYVRHVVQHEAGDGAATVDCNYMLYVTVRVIGH